MLGGLRVGARLKAGDADIVRQHIEAAVPGEPGSEGSARWPVSSGQHCRDGGTSWRTGGAGARPVRRCPSGSARTVGGLGDLLWGPEPAITG